MIRALAFIAASAAFLGTVVGKAGVTPAQGVPFYSDNTHFRVQQNFMEEFPSAEWLSVINNAQTLNVSRICPEMINATNTPFPYLTFTNGACHDLNNPFEGLSIQPHIRTEKAQYLDGFGAPMGFDRPSARVISNAVIRQPDGLPLNIKDSSRLLIFFGQFIDHDFALVLEQELPNPLTVQGESERFDIAVPRNDAVFQDNMVITRSQFVLNPRTGVREFASVLTPYFDLGQVYGDTIERTLSIRGNSVGGAILFDQTAFQATNAQFPPFINPDGSPLCGDVRCGENTQLFAWHALWLRNHNYHANRIRTQSGLNPVVFNDLMFETARVFNILEYQYIVWEQYLSYLLGRLTFFDLTGEYRFQPNVDPTTALIMSTAVFRYGHSGVSNDLLYLNPNLTPIREPLLLAGSFMMPRLTFTLPGGRMTDLVGAMLLGQSSLAHPILDTRVVSGIRDSLFANVPRFAPGSDLPARNIQRGRDHGIDTINNYRKVAGLEPYECPGNPRMCFEQITTNSEIANSLYELYGDISECETWPCAMAEDSFEDSLLGETFTYIMAEEFNRMRVSDRLWYDNDEVRARFSGANPGIRSVLPNVIGASIPTSITAITNRNSLAGANPNGNVFQLRPFWTSYRAPEEFGVEWFTPSNIAQTQFTQYIVRVSPPLMDGASQFIVNRGEIQAYRATEAVNPAQLYNVALLVNFPPNNPTLVGETVVQPAVFTPTAPLPTVRPPVFTPAPSTFRPPVFPPTARPPVIPPPTTRSPVFPAPTARPPVNPPLPIGTPSLPPVFPPVGPVPPVNTPVQTFEPIQTTISPITLPPGFNQPPVLIPTPSREPINPFPPGTGVIPTLPPTEEPRPPAPGPLPTPCNTLANGIAQEGDGCSEAPAPGGEGAGDSSSQGSGSLSGGAIAGIVIAGIVGTVALIGGVVLLKKRANRRQFEENTQTFL